MGSNIRRKPVLLNPQHCEVHWPYCHLPVSNMIRDSNETEITGDDLLSALVLTQARLAAQLHVLIESQNEMISQITGEEPDVVAAKAQQMEMEWMEKYMTEFLDVMEMQKHGRLMDDGDPISIH